jgi:hypothetical protein
MLKSRPLLAFFVMASSAAAASTPLEVTVDQLVAIPKQFNGKRVSVTGYFDLTVHHGCDLRARKTRPDDNRQTINVVVPDASVPALQRLTHNFTRLVRAHIVGTFQYRYVGPVGEKPIKYDRPLAPGEVERKIVIMQVGFGWMGLWDKQITDITEFRVLASPRI